MQTRIAFSTPLLNAKITPGKPPQELVERKALLHFLDQSEKSRISLILGPAGSGKTTLMSAWVNHIKKPVIWLTLEESENEAIQFWRYFFGAAARADTEMSLIGERVSDFYEEPNYLIALFLNRIAETAATHFCVLDDYHLLDNPQLHHWIDFMVEHCPDNLHFLIGSRTRPPLRLQRWKAKGYLRELDSLRLRFSLEESRSFLRYHGHELDDEHLMSLHHKTEGWAAALQLSVLSLSQSGTTARPDLDSLKRNEFFPYLSEELLDSMTPERREALYLLSCYPRIRATREHRLASGESIDAAALARQNLFLQETGDGEYRMHPLLRDFLQERLHAEAPDRFRELHRQLAHEFAAEGDTEAEIEELLLIRAWNEALYKIEAVAPELLLRGEFNHLARWFDTVPEHDLRLFPRLLFYWAWILIQMGKTEEAAKRADQIDPERYPENSRLLKDFIACRISGINGDEGAQSKAERLIGELPPDLNFFSADLLIALGFAASRASRFREATEIHAQATTKSIECRNYRAAGMSAFYRSWIHLDFGEPAIALEIARTALPGDSGYGSGSAWIAMAEAHALYEMDRLDEAARAAEQALNAARKYYEAKVLVYAPISLAYIAFHRGDISGAAELLRLAGETAAGMDLYPLMEFVGQRESYFNLISGNTEAALSWITAVELDPEAPDYSTWNGQILLREALNRPAEDGLPHWFESLLSRRISYFRKRGMHREIARDLIFKALSRRRRGEEYGRFLEEALHLCEQGGFFRSLFDCGPELIPLLEALPGESLPLGLRAAVAEPEKRGERPKNCSRPPALGEEIRPREIEILSVMAEGRSNREIAEELFLAESTIKWHLKNIFLKLDVQNRTMAVRKAREIELIP